MPLIQTPVGANNYNPYGAIPNTGGAQQGGAAPSQAGTLINGVGTKIGGQLASGGDLTGGIVNSIDKAGGAIGFGTRTGAPLVNGVGPTNTITSGALGSTTLSSALGGAGVGGVVAGLTGGNSTAGAVGGAAGMLIGNAIVPGIGGWVGSAIVGGIAGKLFGKSKPSNKLQVGTIQLSDGGYSSDYDTKNSQTGKKFDEGNRSVVDTLRNASSATAQYLLKNGGKSIQGGDPRLIIGAGSRDGLWYATNTVDSRKWEDNQTKVKDVGQLSSGVFDTLVKEYGITDPKIIEQARAVFNQTGGAQLTSGSGGGGLSAIVPEVKNKQDRGGQTFAQFVDDFKKQTGATGGPSLQKKVVA